MSDEAKALAEKLWEVDWNAEPIQVWTPMLAGALHAERVKTLEEVARHCDGTSAFSHPLLLGLAEWCRAKAQEAGDV